MSKQNKESNNDNSFDELLSYYDFLAPGYKVMLVEQCKTLLQLQSARKNSEAS